MGARNDMRFCDFFAGIGGFRLGLERAGHKGVWACEVDPFCRKIYAQHFEEPQGRDINDVKAEEIPEAELWCGGFPCQDLSIAGKRGGLQANRSGLFWVWHELMRKRRPPWLLIENVPGLFSSKGGADFALILSSLDKLGYGVAWRVLDAQFFGLAQRRKRVFIVGRFGKPCPPEILFEREGGGRDTASERKAGSDVAYCLAKRTHKSGDPTTDQYVVAPSLYGSGAGTERTASAGNEAQFVIIEENTRNELRIRQSPPCVQNYGGKQKPWVIGTLQAGGSGKRGWSVGAEDARDGKLVVAYHENIGGHTAGGSKARALRKGASHNYQYVTAPPHPNGMREATGLPGQLDMPDSPRYKALGNAVAVPVVEWIGKRLPPDSTKLSKTKGEKQ